MKPLALTPATTNTTATELTAPPKRPLDEKALKAAKQFESLLLRHMLESMQKTAEVGGKSHTGSAYQSMATEALADGIEQGGGLGLADLVAHTLQAEVAGRTR